MFEGEDPKLTYVSTARSKLFKAYMTDDPIICLITFKWSDLNGSFTLNGVSKQFSICKLPKNKMTGNFRLWSYFARFCGLLALLRKHWRETNAWWWCDNIDIMNTIKIETRRKTERKPESEQKEILYWTHFPRCWKWKSK